MKKNLLVVDNVELDAASFSDDVAPTRYKEDKTAADDSILSPEGDIGNVELAELIDIPVLQSLMDNFYKLAHIPMSITDVKGKVLVGVGWQDICTRFHRAHPDTCRHCIESDTQLSTGVPSGEFKLYKCKNNMWDIATPIMVGGQHVGSVLSGQFFFEGEPLDYEVFRSQARRYGFKEEEYIAALQAVPRLSREALDTGMAFFMQLADIISKLSYSNIKLTQSTEELAEHRKNLEKIIKKRTREIVDINGRLRQSEAQHRLIIEASPDAYFVFTQNKIVYANPAALQLFGCRKAREIDITTLKNLIMPEKYKELENLKGSQKPVHLGEITIAKEANLSVTVEGSVIPIFFEGETADQYIIRDVTERKEIEKEMARLDRLSLIGEMAAGIGHEVRNPMTSVRGFLQLLAKKEPDPKKLEYYDIMIEELDRANFIITEFLSLAKDRTVKLEPTSLNSIINSLYPLLSTDATKQDKRLMLKKGDISNTLLNEKEIRQLIINLVRNGLEAMPAGGSLTIGTYDKNDEIVLFVKDEGTGIKPEIYDKLGTPFVSTKEKGTGLGLSVCYSIANKHNAKIDVKTGTTGTTFYVRFKQKRMEMENV